MSKYEKNGKFAKPKLHAICSQDYLEWVKQANLPPLTNNQHKFAKWLLLEDNAKIIAHIGDLDTIFISVRRWLKNGTSSLKVTNDNNTLI